MKADRFFIAAMQAGCYKLRNWVISAFALIQEGPEAWQADPYPYRIVHTPTGFFFVDPKQGTLAPIELDHFVAGRPPFEVTQTLFIGQDDVANYAGPAPLKTNYGNLLFNFIMFVHAFGAKIEYQNRRVAPGEVEDMILPRLVDDGSPIPKNGIRNTSIFVSEYLEGVEAAFYCTGFTQLWVPADTYKSMTPPPGLKAFKAKLYEENKDRLHDPAVIAMIDAKLIEFDTAYLKGDRSEGFLITSKSRKTVRRKLFLSQGAEMGLDEDVQVDLVPNSLTEGWDMRKFPTMNNAQRAGSFNRGAETRLGGEAVKWLLRASSNMRVAAEDCQTKIGMLTTFTPANIGRYAIGFSVVTKAGHEVMTEENSEKYLGKTLMVRSPLFCKLEKTDYCSVCVGPRLALNPTALSSAVTDYGSAFMTIFMQAAHSRNLVLVHMDVEQELQ